MAKTLASEDLHRLKNYRCKEVRSALEAKVITYEEMVQVCVDNGKDYKDEYFQKIMSEELFPPKFLTEYIRNKKGDFDKKVIPQHVDNIDKRKKEVSVEEKRLEEEARIKEINKRIDLKIVQQQRHDADL